jgi:thiopurine S-methyltransferase
MEKEFWLERWEREEIGFHEGQVNAYLMQFWQALHLPAGSAVFVPLCGKSADMKWLSGQGHAVIGVEVSQIAVEAFFKENGLVATHLNLENFKVYVADAIRILCGDFFDLSGNDLRAVKAVYDRASMIALPPEMRKRYVKHLFSVLPPASQILLVAIDYPQAEMQGPPFSFATEELEALCGEHADIRKLANFDVLAQNPRFQKRGLTRLYESIYLLTLR